MLASTGLFLLWDKASFQYCAHSREKPVSWRVYTKGIRGTGFRARLTRVVCKLSHLHFKRALKHFWDLFVLYSKMVPCCNKATFPSSVGCVVVSVILPSAGPGYSMIVEE